MPFVKITPYIDLTGDVLLVHGLQMVRLASELGLRDTQLDELVEDIGKARARDDRTTVVINYGFFGQTR
jgi:hypothetical protein